MRRKTAGGRQSPRDVITIVLRAGFRTKPLFIHLEFFTIKLKILKWAIFKSDNPHLFSLLENLSRSYHSHSSSVRQVLILLTKKCFVNYVNYVSDDAGDFDSSASETSLALGTKLRLLKTSFLVVSVFWPFSFFNTTSLRKHLSYLSSFFSTQQLSFPFFWAFPSKKFLFVFLMIVYTNEY